MKYTAEAVYHAMYDRDRYGSAVLCYVQELPPVYKLFGLLCTIRKPHEEYDSLDEAKGQALARYIEWLALPTKEFKWTSPG